MRLIGKAEPRDSVLYVPARVGQQAAPQALVADQSGQRFGRAAKPGCKLSFKLAGAAKGCVQQFGHPKISAGLHQRPHRRFNRSGHGTGAFGQPGQQNLLSQPGPGGKIPYRGQPRGQRSSQRRKMLPAREGTVAGIAQRIFRKESGRPRIPADCKQRMASAARRAVGLVAQAAETSVCPASVLPDAEDQINTGIRHNPGRRFSLARTAPKTADIRLQRRTGAPFGQHAAAARVGGQRLPYQFMHRALPSFRLRLPV